MALEKGTAMGSIMGWRKQTGGSRWNLLGAVALVAVCVSMSGCSDRSAALNQAALASLEKGDYAAAEESLKEAVQIKPVDRTLRRNLVEVFFREGKWDEAIRLLSATLAIAGLESDLELRETKAIAHAMAGEPKVANGILRDLLKENPDNEYLLFLDGVTATAPQQAIKSLSRAIEINPDRKESYLAMVRAYAYTGDTEKARQTLDQVKEKFGELERCGLV